MKKNQYSVYDTIAEIFNNPFLAHNHEDAKRAFIGSFKHGEKANKEDYVLYHIAEFNDANGEIKPVVPMKIYSGLDIKEG